MIIEAAFPGEEPIVIRRGRVRGDSVVIERMGGKRKHNIPIDALIRALHQEVGLRVVPADAIVIERGEIKAVGPVDVGRYGLRAGSLTVAHDVTAAEAWASAMEHLAIYLCLRDRPPVDEREVEALAEIIRREDTERQNAGDQASWADIARRLLITGCVHVDTEAVDRD